MPSWLDFNQISDWVSGAWWAYPLIFSVAAVDAFFPLVPSETVVVIGGNLSSSGGLRLPLVILFAAAGAVVGDNISYGIGTFLGERTVKRWFSSPKSLMAVASSGYPASLKSPGWWASRVGSVGGMPSKVSSA